MWYFKAIGFHQKGEARMEIQRIMSEGNTTQPAEKQENVFKNPEWEKLAAIGLGGAGLVFIQAFIPLGMIDLPVTISILAFAVSLPLLGTNLLAVTVSRKYATSKMAHSLFWLGVLGAGVGITAAFWHASWIAGLLFIASDSITIAVILSLLLKDSSINVHDQ
jgi:hypothetical protein